MDSSNPNGDDIDPIKIVRDDGKGSSSSENIFSYVVPLFYSYDMDVFALMAEQGGPVTCPGMLSRNESGVGITEGWK